MRFTPKSVRLKTLDLHNYTTTTPYPSWLTWKCSSKQPCQSPNFHSDNIYTSLMLKYYLFRTDFLTFPAFPCYLQLKAGNSSYVIAKYWLLVMVLSQKEQSEILWNSVLSAMSTSCEGFVRPVEEVFIVLHWLQFAENH